MYEQHFGFKQPPFKAIANGGDVFLGPQTARTIKAVRKALARQDAAVTVSGPVGVGKTTVVGRALDAVGGKQTRIRIGRMSIGHDEILDYLLDVLGVANAPSSTIRRIAAFRAILMQKKQADERVIVIVEDGVRLGEDPLAELEALTAADGGAGGGAALVVMGDTSLRSALDRRSLDRLNQRIRLRHVLEPHSDGELTGYLKHCFRLSGVDFDTLFDKDTAALLCQLAGGIPRVCNNLVESALAAAAEQGTSNVDAELLARIADEEYGLTPRSTSADVSQIAEALVPPPDFPAGDGKPEIEISQTSEMKALSPDAIEIESGPAEIVAADAAPVADEPESGNDTVPELTILSAGDETSADSGDAPADEAAEAEAPPEVEIPALEPELEIPDLEIEAAQPAAEAPSPGAAPAAEAEPEVELPSLELEESAPAAEAPAEAAPEPAPVAAEAPKEGPAAPEVPSTALPEPDWDSEPTLAELRPDLDAIESAMAEDVESTPAVEPVPKEPDVDVALRDPTLPGVPELKLDESIQASIDEARSALEEHDSTIADGNPDGDFAAAAPEQADEELEKIAKGLARAKTLDDVDDKMAETLFGEEFSLIAAQVAASVANLDDDEEEAESTGATDAPAPAAAAQPAATAPAAKPAAQKPAQQPAAAAPAAKPAAAAPAAKPAAAATAAAASKDTSPSERLATVRALNKGNGQAPVADAGGAASPSGAPASIESQFAETMVPASKARSAEVAALEGDDDDGDDKKKGGFFSRFKRS